MKKKLLVAAIASALVSPTAFAAEGADGMNYVSASEGFYGTLRARYDTGAVEDDEAGITTGGDSQIGVRGTLDLGNGLTGHYQWETNVDGGQRAASALRKRTVGLSGGFGSVHFGSQTDSLVDVSGRTDVANSISGNYDLTPSYRVDNSVIYRTPNLNGFDASLRIVAEPTGATRANTSIAARGARDLNLDGDMSDRGEAAVVAADVITTTADENTVDDWALTANYSVQGLSASIGYRVNVDGFVDPNDGLSGLSVLTDLGDDVEVGGTGDDTDTITTLSSHSNKDLASWGFGLNYGQDNWNVGGWYGEIEQYNLHIGGDTDAEREINAGMIVSGSGGNDVAGTATDFSVWDEDSTVFSLGGDVTVGKTKVYAFTETMENVNGRSGIDDTVSGVGVQYSFTTQSRVWMDYQANDKDSDLYEDDKVVIGLRHDF